MPTIRVGVQANSTSAGQIVDIDAGRANVSLLSNVSAESVQYSTNSGATWATVAAGASAVVGDVTAKGFRVRRAASGGYPIAIDVTFTPESNPILGSDADQAAFQSLVSGAGETSAQVNLLLIGDSMTAGNNFNAPIQSCSRSNGIATLVFGGGHTAGNGELCRVFNCSDVSFNTGGYVAVTRVDATTIQYPSPGPDAANATRNLAASRAMTLQRRSVQGDNGYLLWMNSKTGGAFRLMLNAGCNGQTSADMRNYLDAYTAATSFDASIVFTGYNDFAVEGRTADAVLADVLAIVDRLQPRPVIVVSAIPWTTGGTVANRREALKYNRALRAALASRPRTRYADAARYMIDPLSGTVFAPLVNMLKADGIHPGARGHERIAQSIIDATQGMWPTQSRLVSSRHDNYGADATNRNIIDHAPWVSSGGGVAGGATGTVGQGLFAVLSGSGTAVASCPARADGLGFDQQIVYTPGAGSSNAAITSGGYVFGRFQGGDRLQFLCELNLSGLAGSNIQGIEISHTFNLSPTITSFTIRVDSENGNQFINADGTYTIVGPEITVPVGATDCDWRIQLTGSGVAGTAVTMRAGRISFEKL